MASGVEEDNDAVLSDIEAEDPAPSDIVSPAPEDVSVEKFRELMAELDRERQAREAAESSKSELQVSFNRLKALAHEAIKKRDESTRQRDEALREKEEAAKMNENRSAELVEANKLKDEVLKQKDELARQLDEAVKAKDSCQSEIETAAQMLVSGIEKISGKISNFKNFGGLLPKSKKYSGLPAVVYGVIKRTNEIVEELLAQIDTTTKSRNEAREQIEMRNYEIAIEVSQLEATISSLREEISKKNSMVENLEKSISEKDEKICQMENDSSERQSLAEHEVSSLKLLVGKADDKLKAVELKMDLQKSLLVEQLSYVSKIHEQLYNLFKVVDASKLSELAESLFLPQQTDMEECIRASLAGMESIYELSKTVSERTRSVLEARGREVKSLSESISQLVKEKEHVGSLLRSALSRRMPVDVSSKTYQLFKVAENGLKNAGIDFKFINHVDNGKVQDSDNEMDAGDTVEDEIYSLAGALENIIKQSQIEILELQHEVDQLREESSLLKEHVEAQAKELGQWKHRVEELKEKEREANDNVEGLMTDIAAAEEEIARWKVAAQQEAATGKAVEQEFLAQLSAIRQELEDAKQAAIESEKKLKFKEETAAAAIAARDAAEKSLRLADLRASRLRDRLEELTCQHEEMDTRETSGSGRSRPRYVCWPWEWLGLDILGSQRTITQERSSNEMELSEPLL